MLGAIFKITKPGHVVVTLLFEGVPPTISVSRFLSLIRLRLLSDPERTNSPHFAKNRMHISTQLQSPAIILTGGCISQDVCVATHD